MSEVVVHRFPVLEGGVWVGRLDSGQSLVEVLGCLCKIARVGQHHSDLLVEDRVVWGHGQSTLHEADGSGGGASDVVLTTQLDKGELRAPHDPRCLGKGRDSLVVFTFNRKGVTKRHVSWGKMGVKRECLC